MRIDRQLDLIVQDFAGNSPKRWRFTLAVATRSVNGLGIIRTIRTAFYAKGSLSGVKLEYKSSPSGGLQI
ncbi:hypothetical protein [Azomonas macrocytogenes]|uniref:Uncharacterized protein n=1 Tax=Azomonas macrocytogenes TaxID=69962 RepID=A0A839T1X8_AZOMA|nr:hypothetical protein [Azomonas macrocytogenes]MBB3101955.1 hypothetical protein [Azomonas macrocytogenes]